MRPPLITCKFLLVLIPLRPSREATLNHDDYVFHTRKEVEDLEAKKLSLTKEVAELEAKVKQLRKEKRNLERQQVGEGCDVFGYSSN